MRLRDVPIGGLFRSTVASPERATWRNIGPSSIEPGVWWAERLDGGEPKKDRWSGQAPVEVADAT